VHREHKGSKPNANQSINDPILPEYVRDNGTRYMYLLRVKWQHLVQTIPPIFSQSTGALSNTRSPFVWNSNPFFPCSATYRISQKRLKALTSSSLAGLTPSENISQNATKL